MDNTVYVVHSVDAEGPLYESVEGRFELLENLFGIKDIEPTEHNFKRIMNGDVELGENAEVIRFAFNEQRLNFMDNWDKLDEMVSRVTGQDFRNLETDSFGGGYVYNWFCIDHVGFETNPRRRTLGYHAILDYYRQLGKRPGNDVDGLYWHFHPMSIYKEAYRCGTSLLNSPHIIETLARRILERESFPSCVRCGFQAERPDIHWLLEQYVPFDFTNTALDDQKMLDDMETQKDLANGRYGDWRLAPRDWGVYQPSHDNYQLPGNCRRWISRSLNIGCRFGNLDDRETEKAFAQAAEGKPTLLGIATHDHRDIQPEVEELRGLLARASAKYPKVKFKYAEAREAMRAVVYDDKLGEELDLELTLERGEDGKPLLFRVKTIKGEVFGPQPFLSIETKGKRFIHDNMDFGADLKSWTYTFDVETVLPDDLAAVGVGANDKFGNTVVKQIKVDG